MMFFYAVFLFITFAANAELRDGPCLPPSVTFDWYAVTGQYPNEATWYALSSNYYKAETARKCFEIIGKPVGRNYQTTFSYLDNQGQHTHEVNFVPIDIEQATFDKKIKSAEGDWIHSGWQWTPVAIEDKYVIEHICQEEGDKHEDFFAIFGLDKNMPEKVADKLKKIAEDHGDEREFVLLSHEDC